METGKTRQSVAKADTVGDPVVPQESSIAAQFYWFWVVDGRRLELPTSALRRHR
jgi:hypothetical protein